MRKIKAAVLIFGLMCLMPSGTVQSQDQDKYRLDATITWSNKQLQDAVAHLRRIGLLPEMVGKAGELPYNPERIAQHQDLIILVELLLRRIDTLESRLNGAIDRKTANLTTTLSGQYASKPDVEDVLTGVAALENRADRLDASLQTNFMTGDDLTRRFSQLDGTLDSLSVQATALKGLIDTSYISVDTLALTFSQWDTHLSLIRADMDALKTVFGSGYLRKDEVNQKAEKAIDKYARSYVEEIKKKKYAQEAVTAALDNTDIQQQLTNQLEAHIEDQIKADVVQNSIDRQISQQLTEEIKKKIKDQIIKELTATMSKDIEEVVQRLTDEKIKAFEQRMQESPEPPDPPL